MARHRADGTGNPNQGRGKHSTDLPKGVKPGKTSDPHVAASILNRLIGVNDSARARRQGGHRKNP